MVRMAAGGHHRWGLLLAVGLSMALACGASSGLRALSAAAKVGRVGAKGAKTAGKGIGDIRQAARAEPMPVVAGEGLGLEGLGTIGDVVDVAQLGYDGYDLAVLLIDSDLPPPSHVLVGDATPRLVNLTSDSGSWRRFVDGQEPGHAPLIVVGQPSGDALFVDDEAVPLSKLAATCWSSGTTCVFIACVSCVGETRDLLEQHEKLFTRSVGTFTSELVEAILAVPAGTTESPPVFVAVAGGVAGNEIQLLRPSTFNQQ